jgi:hypothetical protein
MAKPTTYRVVGIDDEGRIELEGYGAVKLAGVVCDPSGISNIRKMLTDAGVFVAFVTEPQKSSNPVPANLWMVQELQVDGRSDVSYIHITEAALTSGWCSSVRAGQVDYSARYEALEEFHRHFK